MPYISLQDTKSIWQKTPDYDWRSLRSVLESQYYEDNDELNSHEANRMLTAVARLTSKKVPFPRSYKELYEVLNEWAA